MVKSYDIDLREKLIDFIEQGHRQCDASLVFGVSLKTVSNWVKRYKSDGHFLPRKNKGKKPRISKDEFTQYIECNSGKTLSQIGKHFNMGTTGAHYYMKKYGFSYKKKSPNIRSWMKEDEKNI